MDHSTAAELIRTQSQVEKRPKSQGGRARTHINSNVSNKVLWRKRVETDTGSFSEGWGVARAHIPVIDRGLVWVGRS